MNQKEIVNMANIFRSNPQLFKQFNEYIINNNDNFIKSTTNPKYMKGVSKGQVPRRIFNQNNENKTFIIDSNLPCLRRNIIFQMTAGNKFIFVTPINLKIKDLLKEFITKIGFNVTVLSKDINFLHNGESLKINEERTVDEMRIYDNQAILVVDTKGIIGANK